MQGRKENFPDNGFEEWGGYMHAKIAKLEEQFLSRASKEDCLSNIFNGVSIYVNGFTNPSADELKALMSKHGGVYHTYQRSEDFIIASNLPDTKVKNMNLAKVVKPEWITESLAANKLLDYRDYLLYKNSRTQMQLQFHRHVKVPNMSECNSTTSRNDFNKNISTMKTEIHTLATDNSENCKSIEKLKNVANGLNVNVKQEISAKTAQATKTAADPNFISEFYSNSRLHHISQLGAYFKQHVNDLREQNDFKFPACLELKERIKSLNGNSSQLSFEKGKTIMHIDMDCFFVSVGLRNRPDLRGKPVAVTHSKGGQPRAKRPGVDRNIEFNLYKQKQVRKLASASDIFSEDIEIESRVDGIADEGDKYGSMSEIASCSYEARAQGVGNGMFMGKALKLCPELQTIPYDFEGYKEVAYTLYNTIAQYTLNIEAISCDEMYVDCTELLKDIDVAVQDFATILRDEIRVKTGCPCSTGFGGNRLQARLATKRAKPDGQFFLTADLVEDFMYNIKLKDLPGVGRQIEQKLETLGHTTCGSLQNLSLASLKCHLGNKTGAHLFDQCRGRDNNPLTFNTVRKSVSAEVNYGIRFENEGQCIDFLKQLSAEVHTRMQQFKVLGKCVTLKLMVRAEEAPVETAKFMGHGFCNVINKSTSLITATNDADIVAKEVIGLCKKQNIDPKEMRGVGIQVTKLEPISKANRGALSKFLCNNVAKDVVKVETKKEINLLNDLKPLNDKFRDYKPIIQHNVSSGTSPKKKSPVKAITKYVAKRKGRPPKTLGVKNVTSVKHKKNLHQGCNLVIERQEKKSVVKNEVAPKEMKQERAEGLIGLPWQKVRELVRAWIDSGQNPLACDIQMIATYLRDLVERREIEYVSILINFLKRRSAEVDNTDWVEVYNLIEKEVQNAMLTVYGKILCID